MSSLYPIENVAALPTYTSYIHVKVGDLYYNLNTALRTAELTFKFDSQTNANYIKGRLTIPETISFNDVTYRVNCIGYGAFQYCDRLTAINFNSIANYIKNYAFYGCSGLTELNIPTSIKFIGDAAFARCTNLIALLYKATTCVYMGDPMYPVFRYCPNLRNINISENVTHLPDYGLWGCNNLVGKTINIPSSVANSDDNLFFPTFVMDD